MGCYTARGSPGSSALEEEERAATRLCQLCERERLDVDALACAELVSEAARRHLNAKTSQRRRVWRRRRTDGGGHALKLYRGLKDRSLKA